MGKGPGSTMVLGEAFEGSWGTDEFIMKSSKGCIAGTSWASPAAIGTGTPAAGTFSTLTVVDGTLLHLGNKTDPDPAGSNGDLYYNTTSNKAKVYENGSWVNIVGTSVPVGANNELLTNDGAGGITSEANATFDGTDFDIASGGAYQFGGSDVIANPGTDNLLLGIGAGVSRTSFGQSFFAGTNAGFSMTSGASNIACGAEAMYSGQNSGLCAAMGYQALRANVSSSLNTAIGFQAGLSYTQARGTFIGGEAGKLSTTGANMLCLGGEAAEANTTGNSITAIGSRSMTSKGTSNSFNTCIGVESGRDNTSNDGVFIGYWSGRLATSGCFQSVGVGTSAMQNLSTGNQNTGLGHLIFNTLTTGSRNIGIGWFADVSTNSINSSIVIGYNAHLTASNQCVIGSEVNNGRIYDFYWGCGVSRVSPSDVTHHGSGASGTDNAAADFIWEVGLSTGNADPAEFLWRTTDIGASGSTAQTASTTMRLNEDGLTVERALQVNGGATSTVADTVNVVGMTVTQNDVTNNPTALAVTNAGTGHGAHVQSADTDSIVWQALFENPRNNVSVTGYGSGIRMGVSTFASGGNEDDKWCGIATVQETTFANTSGMAFYTSQDAGGGSAPTEKMRLSAAGYLGVRVTAPSTPLHVDQDDSVGAVPVATLDQGDTDESFINYIGTSAADTSSSISTEPSGDTSASTVAAPHSASWTLDGMIRCEVNGVDAWIPYYSPV